MNVIDKICGKFGLSDPDEDEKLALAEEEERERERSQKRAAEQRRKKRWGAIEIIRRKRQAM